jgi:hypothetical protein
MLFQMIVLAVGSCVVGGLHCGNIGAESTGGCAVCVMELGTFLKCFNSNPPRSQLPKLRATCHFDALPAYACIPVPVGVCVGGGGGGGGL